MKKILPIIVALAAVGGVSFFGGIKYAENKRASNFAANRNGNFNFHDGADGGMNGNRRAGGQGGAGFVSGEIISKDNGSLTVKLRDGGSKIVFFSTSTQVMKTAAGSADDLKAGETISVTGMANQDGSVTAQNIQLRPASSTFSGADAN